MELIKIFIALLFVSVLSLSTGLNNENNANYGSGNYPNQAVMIQKTTELKLEASGQCLRR